jgi:hypothetical protein
MKKALLLFIFLFLKACIAHAQVVKDSLSNNIVSFVEIYSDKGDLIGLTNNNGTITNELINIINSSNTRKVTFVHHSFKDKVIEIEFLKKEPVVFLSPFKNKNKLEEIVVSGIKKQHKYLKLEGYFRSIQINENKPQYFIDGMVAYYINIKTGKVKAKILANRSLENKAVKQLSTSFLFIVAGVPKPDNLLKINTISKLYNVKEIDNTHIEIGNKEPEKGIGSIQKKDAFFEIQLAVISNQNPRVMKAFGMESILSNYNINAFYQTNSYSTIGLNNVVSFKEIRNYSIKKKQKDNYTKIEAVHEFFVTKKEYVNSINTNKMDTFYSFKTPSSYMENYWEAVDNAIFQSMPISLTSYLKENMVEIKNK